MIRISGLLIATFFIIAEAYAQDHESTNPMISLGMENSVYTSGINNLMVSTLYMLFSGSEKETWSPRISIGFSANLAALKPDEPWMIIGDITMFCAKCAPFTLGLTVIKPFEDKLCIDCGHGTGSVNYDTRNILNTLHAYIGWPIWFDPFTIEFVFRIPFLENVRKTRARGVNSYEKSTHRYPLLGFRFQYNIPSKTK